MADEAVPADWTETIEQIDALVRLEAQTEVEVKLREMKAGGSSDDTEWVDRPERQLGLARARDAGG